MAYALFEQRLRRRGFRDDGRVICRWHHTSTGLMLDAMPNDAGILGFENRWLGEAIAHAATVTLPSGAVIRCAPPAYLLATKFEAFGSRGRGDMRGSKDFEDVVALLDGRAGLLGEIASSPRPVQRYVAAQARGLLNRPELVDALEGAMPYGQAGQERATLVVEPRLRALAVLGDG